MPAFHETLANAAREEWRSEYCDYNALMRLTARCAASGAEADEESFIERYESELSKVQGFVRMRMAEVSSRLAVLRCQCEKLPKRPPTRAETASARVTRNSRATHNSSIEDDGAEALLQPAAHEGLINAAPASASLPVRVGTPSPPPAEEANGDGGGGGAWPAAFPSKAARTSMRTAFVSLHRTARHLDEYLVLNETAFAKAAKKFRKVRPDLASRGVLPFPVGAPPPAAADADADGRAGSVLPLVAPPASRPSQVSPTDSASQLLAVAEQLVGSAPASPASLRAGGSCAAPRDGGAGDAAAAGAAAVGLAGVGPDGWLLSLERAAAAGFGLAPGTVASLLAQIEQTHRAAFYGRFASATEARAQLVMRQHEQSGNGRLTYFPVPSLYLPCTFPVPSTGNGRLTYFLLGWRVGAAAICLIWLAWDLVIDEQLRPDAFCVNQKKKTGSSYLIWHDPALYVFSFVSAFIVFEWCW